MSPGTNVDVQAEEKIYGFLWNLTRIVQSIISHFIALCLWNNLNKGFKGGK